MIQDPDHPKRLAQTLVQLLMPYEEEFIALEQADPSYGPLRRALGIVIAEACYCISDLPANEAAAAPTAASEAPKTR